MHESTTNIDALTAQEQKKKLKNPKTSPRHIHPLSSKASRISENIEKTLNLDAKVSIFSLTKQPSMQS